MGRLGNWEAQTKGSWRLGDAGQVGSGPDVPECTRLCTGRGAPHMSSCVTWALEPGRGEGEGQVPRVRVQGAPRGTRGDLQPAPAWAHSAPSAAPHPLVPLQGRRPRQGPQWPSSSPQDSTPRLPT